MANGPIFSLGDGRFFGLPVRERAKELELLKSVDDLIVVRVAGLMVDFFGLMFTKCPSLLKSSNKGLSDSDLVLEPAGEKTVGASWVLQSRADGETVFGKWYSEETMGFDNRAQDMFEALLQVLQVEDLFNDTVWDNLLARLGGLLGDEMRHVGKDFKRLKEGLKDLFVAEGEDEAAAGQMIDGRLRDGCVKALKKYCYRRCEIKTDLRLANADGEREVVFGQVVERIPEPGGFKNVVTIKTDSPNCVLASFGNSNLVSVTCRITYTAGVRELIKEAMEAYEKAAPIEKAAGARYGKIGEKVGEKADDLVLRVLAHRFRAEEPEVNIPSKFLLLHDKKSGSVAGRLQAAMGNAICRPYEDVGGASLRYGGNGAVALLTLI